MFSLLGNLRKIYGDLGIFNIYIFCRELENVSNPYQEFFEERECQLQYFCKPLQEELKALNILIKYI